MRILIIIISAFIFGCHTTPQKEMLATPPELHASLGKYISQYVRHKVSINEPDIKIKFAGAVVNLDKVGSEVGQDVVKVIPHVPGSFYWKDQSTLIFNPAKRLEYNTKYNLEIKLTSLYDEVDESFKLVTIPFVTKPLSFDIQYSQLDYSPLADKDETLQISGSISATDYIDNEVVEKFLSATQPDNKNIQIIWDHPSGSQHSFKIINIIKNDKQSHVKLKWDGKKYDSLFFGQRKFHILPKEEFKVIHADCNNGENRFIEIVFSNRLDESQDLTGLISIDKNSNKLKFDIERNRIFVYPDSRKSVSFNLTVNKGIRNTDNEELNESWTRTLSFEPMKPKLRELGKGVIVPNNDKIIFPFEAANLKSATVKVLKIYQDNVLQFLQNNTLDGGYNLQWVGRVVHTQKINLSRLNPENNDDNFLRYALDLKPLVDLEPGAVYNIEISFNKDDVSSYPCEAEDNNDRYSSDDPCKQNYYRSYNFIRRNLLASNLGIICKRNPENDLKIIITDLRTTLPVQGAEITTYDLQKQKLKTATTDKNGMVNIRDLDREPIFCIVKSKAEYGYVSLADYRALSTSEFDVSGKNTKSGINGFLYGERGVWRPGDTLFLNFMLEDKNNTLPSDHPVQLTLTDSRGKKKFSHTSSTHVKGIYAFVVPTAPSDPTGNWTAVTKIGNNTFRKFLKIETVKPNRLKIKLDLGKELNLYAENPFQLSAQWLHGASAEGLKSKVDLSLQSKKPSFKGYEDYVFYDIARKIDNNSQTIFDGLLDANGEASVTIKNQNSWKVPGMLRASLNTKVYEKSGNFSEDNYTIDAHLYDTYVGLNVPKTKWGYKFVPVNKKSDFQIVLLDTDGSPVSGRNLSIGIYRAEWNWWYDRSYSSRYNYNTSDHRGALEKANIKTNNKGEASYELEIEEYGNYMIRVCDETSGHCTGELFYSGRYWRDRGKSEGQQLLSFITDKKDYSIGEKIKVSIPTNEGSKLLVSLETAEEVISTYWINGQKNQTDFEIPTDDFGNQTLYINVSLVQAYNKGDNDLPIRTYGIVPVNIIDPKTQLNPRIDIPNSIRPDEKVTIRVTEENSKPMAYTLSVVDEGLLSLTRHKTADPWSFFYAKQALGIKSWDIFDKVLNGYGGEINRWISIGGDGENTAVSKSKEANRFKPVVKQLGPFYLPAGKTGSHEIQIDNYVGEVRTMVVARDALKYGSAEKSTAVKKPLMVQSTVPRVLGPNENLRLPVNVFAMDDKIKNVTVKASVSDNINLIGEDNKRLKFDRVGDQLLDYNLSVANHIGPAKIEVKAISGNEEAQESIEVQIRNPNPHTTKVQEVVLKPGEVWEGQINNFGSIGTNASYLEASQFPSIDFNRRLNYLIRYPYGCIEQTTSSIFPQLYLDVVSELSDKQKYQLEKNIKRGIERLSLFQLSNGGMSYWPGNSNASSFGSIYAAHFLLEAKEKGFTVSDELLTDLTNYLFDISETKTRYHYTEYQYHQYLDAYRLYVLSMSDKPNLGAMNRMRNAKILTNVHFHILAAAYANLGKPDIAKELIARQSTEVPEYFETGYSYGSHIRDLAMIAESLRLTGNENESAKLIRELAKEMSSRRWYSTQTTAISLLAIGKFLKSYKKDNLQFEYDVRGTKHNIISVKPIKKVELNSDIESVSVVNTSENVLFVKLVTAGQLPPGVEENATQTHIKLDVIYTDRQGKPIDIANLKQGTDFQAIATVTNMGSRAHNIEEVALSQIFPSGWEIQNTRLSGTNQMVNNSYFEYQDIRDDRVNTFFDIHGRDPLKFTILLTASYQGKFYLPPAYVEAMYDNEIQAKIKGQWVNVN